MTTAHRLMRPAGAFCALWMAISVTLPAAPARAQLRVVTYNTATASDSAFLQRQTYFRDILEYIGKEPLNGVARNIDVLVLQEQSSSCSTANRFAAELNSITGTSDYVAWSETPYTSDGLQVAFVYNSAAVSLQLEDWMRTDNSRSTGRVTLRPTGYGPGADLTLYSTHYKAGTSSADQTRRRDTAFDIRVAGGYGQKSSGGTSGVRFGSDYLPADAHVVYAGDYNQKSSYEDANHLYGFYENPYAIMQLGSADGFGPGQGVDPLDAPGYWGSNYNFAEIHTQSPHDGSYGLVTGGMDDRFDFMLVSQELADGEGLSLIAPGIGDSPAAEQSYHTFGNDGTCYNQPANSGGNTGLNWIMSELGESVTVRNRVRDALAKASDHCPVVMDLQLPARLGATVESAPEAVIRGTPVALDVTVENTAGVTMAVAADELDYGVSTAGDLSGTANGSVAAAVASVAHQVDLDTDFAGAKAGTVHVVSTSQGVADGVFSQNVGFDVLDPSEASFGDAADVDALSVDFGTVRQYVSGVAAGFAIQNLEVTAGYTASLDLDAVAGSGDVAVLGTDLAPLAGIEAGTAAAFTIWVNTGAVGAFAAAYTVRVSDEDVLGAGAGSDLVLDVTATVSLFGDVDLDGDSCPADIDAADIDALFSAVGTTSVFADLDDSGLVAQGAPHSAGDADILILDVLGSEWGDATLDGVVDTADYFALSAAWGGPGGWADGDFTGDGLVDTADYFVLSAYWGKEGALAEGVLPEPGSLAMLALGGLVALRRKRRT